MLKHVIYVAFAVILGVAMMIFPLITSLHIDFIRSSQQQLGEAERTKEKISISGFQSNERLTSKFVASLPHAMFIVASGLTVATAVLILAKRRLI